MNQMKMNQMKMMDDLPELSFEKILSYLSLEDLIRSRAVSRSWRYRITSFKVKSLCLSNRAIEFVHGKSRLVSGAFAQNFVGSPRYDLLLSAFGGTILAKLQRLRLCEFYLDIRTRPAFAPILNSLGGLEALDIIRFSQPLANPGIEFDLELNLPMLRSIRIENVRGIGKLILDAPKLQKVKLWRCGSLRLDIVHGESVERLLTNLMTHIGVKKLKNLKFLYNDQQNNPEIDFTFLADLEQLKEIHLNSSSKITELFQQKRRYLRADLKVYLCGLLLSGPDDPAISSVTYPFNAETIAYLTENRSRLADEIPLCQNLPYSAIERLAAGVEATFLNRFTDLERIRVDEPVQDVERFRNFLTNWDNIAALVFLCDQPQDLFDRLPEHNVVQRLVIVKKVADLEFLFRLFKHLTHLNLNWSIDVELIRKVFEELKFVLWFRFIYANKEAAIQIDHLKRFEVWIEETQTIVSDLNAAIQLIIEKTAA